MKFLYIIIFILLPPLSLTAHANHTKITQPYGLFFVQDNELGEGKEIFKAPTLKTDVDVTVQGLLTTTTVKQHFINPTSSYMEATYLFPLPDKSAVDHLLMKIGDRYIEGVIQEKEEAEQTYQKAKKSGKKTSLISSTRSNIFKTKLANIAPGELIVLEIRYHSTLAFQNGNYSLRIPTVINYRYMHPRKKKEGAIAEEESVFDPEIHSPRNEQTTYTINPYSIRVNLNVGFAITPPKSIDQLEVEKISASHFRVSLADGTMPSTKDFVLSFSPITSTEPYIQIYGEEVDDDFYLYGLINPQIKTEDLQLMEKTAITVVADISGSMSGASLRQMQSLLIDFINQLPEYHHLNIIAFNDYHFKLFAKPKEANASTKMQALQFVKNLVAEKGTNMLPPVYEAILENTDLPMKHQIVLMTDGDIGFETEMMAVVHEHIGNKRLHVVGIGSAPNNFLVKNLAKVGRGSHLYGGGGRYTSKGFKYSGEEFNKKKARDLLFKINRPVIENLRLVMMRNHEILPKQFPDVLANEPITFFMKFPYTRLDDLTKPLTLKGNKNSRSWKFSITKDQIQEGQFLDQLWAREKIDSLSFLRTVGFLDQMNFEKQVIGLALQHQLVTKFTSLVAVDENISRNPNEPIFSHQIAQNIPEGWVDPEVMKQATSVQNYISNSNTIDAWSMKPIELEKFPATQVQFVQTATGKELFYLLACILLSGAAFLFYFRQRLY
jgi:Ca-activated chloride channel family protein